MIYQHDFYKGYPILTVNKFGQGKVYYIGADVEWECYDDLYGYLLKEAQLTPIIEECVPTGIEVTARQSDTMEYIIIQNYNGTVVKMGLSEKAYHILKGESMQEILPLETLIVQRKKVVVQLTSVLR